MLADAAAEDAEAGFPAVDVDDRRCAGANHLLVWLAPDNRPGNGVSAGPPLPILVAYLRVEPTEEVGLVRFVVRPTFRSKGIATLLFEELGLDLRAPAGWAGTGVRALRAWARGNHPAAERMCARFRDNGVRRARREWQLLAPLRAGMRWPAGGTRIRPFDPDLDTEPLARLRECGDRPAPDGVSSGEFYLFGAPGVPGGPGAPGDDSLLGAVAVDPDAAQRTEYGTAGRITEVLVHPEHTDGALRTDLLVTGMELLRAKGLRVAVITVDSSDAPMVRDCRLLGFLHDRTDAEYQVTAPADGPDHPTEGK